MEDGDSPSSARSRTHVVTAVLLGAGLALAGPVAGALWSAAAGEPDVRVWAADRDGLALIGLDAELFVRRRVPLRWPVLVEGRADGGAWVATAETGDALGPHGLWRVAPDGAQTRVAGAMPLLDLACLRGGDALLVELVLERRARVRRVAPEGVAQVLLEGEGLTTAAGVTARVLVGDELGGLELVAADGSGTRFAAARLPGPVVDVAPAPRGWWVLCDGGGELARLGADLKRQWSAPTGLAALQLVPVPAAEQVWLADASQPHVRRFGAGGVLELELDPVPLSGLQRGVADGSGAVLFSAPGALLAYDAWGAARPGQGGFTYLTDVARVP